MGRRSLALALAAAGLAGLALAGPDASAHHAFAAEFDEAASVVLKGSVTKVEWINPHAWIHLAVIEATSKGGPKPPPGAWMIETTTTGRLTAQRVPRESLKQGTMVTVTGYWAKDRKCNPCRATGRQLEFAVDQRKAFIGSTGTGAPKDGMDPREPVRR